METKKGALTQDELQALWLSAVDVSYSRPIVEAGDGNGLEVYGQLFNQLERVSQAVDTTTQAMFLCPWSGQSAPEAEGEESATVTLTFERGGLLERPLVLGRGLIFVQEETTDVGEYEGLVVLTGRRYVLTEDLVFHPGERGPFQVVALAERPGYGYNNPMPDTIRRIAQPGERLSNDHASVTAFDGILPGVLVTTPNAPDTFVPESVGQFVGFSAGANLGRASRISTFTGPDLGVSPAIGSSVILELLVSFDSVVYAGTFLPGETVSATGASLRVLGERDEGARKLITLVMLSGVIPAPGAVLTGLTSGATLTTQTVLHDDTTYLDEAPPSPGVGGATWRILGWHTDWALTVTHPLSPEGGRAGWLDEIGKERDLYRSPGEIDSAYRVRLKDIGDVVSPNAIVRTINKIMLGLPFCFREVGASHLPGFFYDGDGLGPSATPPGHSPGNDAYDAYGMVLQGALTGAFLLQEPTVLETTDTLIRWASGIYTGNFGANHFFSIAFGDKPPGSSVGLQIRGLTSGATLVIAVVVPSAGSDDKKWNVYLSFTEFRAFFLVCMPRLGLGEYGFSYDVGPHSAFDATLEDNFFDGVPYQNATIYGALFNAIDPIRAGGVGFDLCLGDTSCSP